MKRKPVVGEKLFSLNIGNATRNREQTLTPVLVSKVGRKYFSVKKEGYNWETEYHLDTWQQKTDYSPDSQLYESEQEYLDMKQKSEILKQLRSIFDYSGSAHLLSLETLRKIKMSIYEN